MIKMIHEVGYLLYFSDKLFKFKLCYQMCSVDLKLKIRQRYFCVLKTVQQERFCSRILYLVVKAGSRLLDRNLLITEQIAEASAQPIKLARGRLLRSWTLGLPKGLLTLPVIPPILSLIPSASSGHIPRAAMMIASALQWGLFKHRMLLLWM